MAPPHVTIVTTDDQRESTTCKSLADEIMRTAVNDGESLSLMELFKSMEMLSSASTQTLCPSPRKSSLRVAEKNASSRPSSGGFELLWIPDQSNSRGISRGLARKGQSDRSLFSLERKLGALTLTIKAQRKKEEHLLQRIEEVKETEKMIGAANTARILQLKRELSVARSSLTKQSSKQRIVKRNSCCVVTSLKENFCDVPDDKEELEAESVWEVNTKISMVRRMRRELQDNNDVIRTNRNVVLKSNKSRIETCEEIMHRSTTLQMYMEELIRRIRGNASIRNMADSGPENTQHFITGLMKRHRTLSGLHHSKTNSIRQLTKAIAKCSRLSVTQVLSVPPAIKLRQSCQYQYATSETDDIRLSKNLVEVLSS